MSKVLTRTCYYLSWADWYTISLLIIEANILCLKIKYNKKEESVNQQSNIKLVSKITESNFPDLKMKKKRKLSLMIRKIVRNTTIVQGYIY